jgi:cobalamin biosynthesis protein CbiD
MILIFGGTTEGRKAVQVVDKAGKPFFYSTKGTLQEVTSAHGTRITGAMNTERMSSFCRENQIKLIIDAAHPFAKQLHQTIADVSEQTNIPVIRFDRIYPPRDKDLFWCDDYANAIIKLEECHINKLVALTGVNTISQLKPFWTKHPTWFRILKREESLQIAQKNDFPKEQLLFYETDEDATLLQKIYPDAVLLKESGVSGGFMDKVIAAREKNIRVFVIKHPLVPDEFYLVNGEHGLRRTIEQLLPGFYSLRTGITTGTCATAGAVAAVKMLLTGKENKCVPVLLPNGETIIVPVESVDKCKDGAVAKVIKDSGDDTDVTNGTTVETSVEMKRTGWWRSQIKSTAIIIKGGKGIGTVTLPGLGLPIGSSAINAGPQSMIRENILRELEILHKPVKPASQIEVTISVLQGEELAARTFNSRLGIKGGISIIGTSGIIQPFSVEAFISSIRKALEVANAANTPRVVINSGAKSEKYLRNYYPELPEAAFVQYGNYIGETLKIASELNIKAITLGVMIGKAVKLAEGCLDTHSKKGTMNKKFLQQVAAKSGCSKETIKAIEHITLARELWLIIPEQEAKAFFGGIIARCRRYCIPFFPKGELNLLLIEDNGDIVQGNLCN